MTFSDALPIQFWLTGCETYNEYEACGVHHKCWCQPWQCDDEINLQFTDYDNLLAQYQLGIYDSDGNLLIELPFSNNNGVNTISFIPSNLDISPDLCGQKVQFKILYGVYANISDFSDWYNSLAGTEPWTFTDTDASIDMTGSYPLFSKRGRIDVLIPIGSSVTIEIDYEIIDFDLDSFRASIGYGVSAANFQEVISTGLSVGSGTISGTIIASEDYEYAQIYAISNADASQMIISRFEIIVDTDDVYAKSDCLDIQESHECSVLINYSNERNFNNLIYSGSGYSPEESFSIRIPAVFFHDRFPQDQEVFELTNSVISLNSSTKKQRLLDTNMMPYHMHNKLNLILMHSFIAINSVEYVKEEEYELLDGDRRWPLRRAQCFLTQKNSITRNIL